ncbi:MAG: 3-phosphoshikimate 1-carboxyvinyltransferase [Alphaproteobacteria bacterium]|nr:3-phosphoshikimate 1-carboxyvinyltransferase [Alphaproteobacteria bacterium]
MTDQSHSPAPLTAHGADPLGGRLIAPGDSQLAQRALLLTALTVGTSTLTGMPQTPTLLALARTLRTLGVVIYTNGDHWQVQGLGHGGLLAPTAPLALGATGDAAGLLLGVLAAHDMDFVLEADTALPQATLDALSMIGAHLVDGEASGTNPIWRGPMLALPIKTGLNGADEITKSALLLAGIQLPGISEVREAVATSNHSEALLAALGAESVVETDMDGQTTISVKGGRALQPITMAMPADPALAGYGVVAALIVPGSDVVIEGVLANPLRTGLIDALLQMGGDISFINQRQERGEHVADLRVRSSWLRGLTLDAAQAAMSPQEIAPLAIAAAYGEGETVLFGLADDGLAAALAAGLTANRVKAHATGGRLVITGERKVPGGGMVSSGGDGRIAMAFALLGLASKHKVTIDDGRAIDTIFPGYVAALSALGGHFPASKGR